MKAQSHIWKPLQIYHYKYSTELKRLFFVHGAETLQNYLLPVPQKHLWNPQLLSLLKQYLVSKMSENMSLKHVSGEQGSVKQC